MIKDYITTIYHYRIFLDEKLAKYNNDYKATCFEIVFDNETKYIQNSSFEFSSHTQLTLKEVEDKLKGTVGIDKIEGSFKTQTLESKYYTPTIEEFHIGFEYEVLAEDFGINTFLWLKHTNPYRIEILENFIESNYVRVKYLDRSDLEDLGWKPDKERQWSLESPNRHSCFYIDNASMTFYEDENIVSIKCKNKVTNTASLCSFKIKNKSELKVLMQQLNITE